MESLLTPGGFLYAGHSERLPLDGARMRPAGLTIYRKGANRTRERADTPGGADA